MELLFVVDTTRLLVAAPLFLNKQSVASLPATQPRATATSASSSSTPPARGRGLQLALSHVLGLFLDPRCLVCGRPERQNALCQAQLLLALAAEHSILLDRSQDGARRGRRRVLVTRQYIRFSFVIPKTAIVAIRTRVVRTQKGAHIRVLHMARKQPLTCDASMQQVLPALAINFKNKP